MDVADDSARAFYDRLAADYHLIYADWDAAIRRQGDALDAAVRGAGLAAPVTVLDCACGIGTQAIGLALRGHAVTGSDLSPAAAARAGTEAARRGVRLPTLAADMRRLPFRDGAFDVLVCADNSLPHLLTGHDVVAALAEMQRVLRAGGLVLISTRPYDELRRDRPTSTSPQVHGSGTARTVTFQLWDWHADGERYDLEHVQLHPHDGGYRAEVRRTTYWALPSAELSELVRRAGFVDPSWQRPEDTGFFQPILVARAPLPS